MKRRIELTNLLRALINLHTMKKKVKLNRKLSF